MKYSISFSCLFIGCLLAFTAHATHNRAGEITYRQTDILTIEVTITTYTKASSLPAERCSLLVQWGDGSSDWLFRANGSDTNGDGCLEGELLGNDYKLNHYTGTHIYASQSTYTISMTDPNRNGGILNVNPPNSDNVPFCLFVEVSISNPMFSGFDSSPVMLEPPIDFGYVGQVFMHTPNAFDIDGDSISYELAVPCMGSIPQENYLWPTEIGAGDDNTLQLNPITGLLIWDAPQIAGEYVITYLIHSWRQGTHIGSVMRDMQIVVEEMMNLPPNIQIENYSNTDLISVEVGDTVRLEIDASEFDSGQQLAISSSCGLYDFFSETADYQIIELTENSGLARFEWIVREEHRRDASYQLVVKAKDNFGESGSAGFAVLRLKVAGVLDSQSEPTRLPQPLLFANPVTDVLHLSQVVEQLRIFDTQGRLLLEDRQISKINCSRLLPGVYWLEAVFRNRESFVWQFLKQ